MTVETVRRVRCDRCGCNEVIRGSTEHALPQGFARMQLRIEGPIVEQLTKDLCGDCNGQLGRFLRGDRLESGWVDPESLKPR